MKAISLKALSILSALLLLSYRKSLTHGKMLKALTFGGFDSLLSIFIPLGARA